MDNEISWEELEAKLQGCVMLIGLTFVDLEDELMEQYQTSGTFERFSEDGFMLIKRGDAPLFQLPYDPDTISAAAAGEYRERTSGEVIVDPDYLIRWTITVRDAGHLDEIKQYGFVPEA